MPFFQRLLFPFLLSILTLALAGCSSTDITEKWHAKGITMPRAKKVLLLSLIKDPVVRAYFEDRFVARAKANGYEVVASHSLAPNATDMDEEAEVRDIVRRSGAEGVLVAQLQGVVKDYKHVPSRLDWYPDAYYNSVFYDYYFQSYRGIYRPGYIASDDYFKMQFRYFDVNSEKLVWAANLSTKNPRSIEQTVREITDEVLDSLKGAGLI